MHPTDDPKYAEFGDHGKRTYEALTKDRNLSQRQLEIVKELARLSDMRSVLTQLSSRYSNGVYNRTKTFPDVVRIRDLYEVERRAEGSVPEHRTVAGICARLKIADTASVRAVAKITQVKATELAARLENIVKL